MRVASCPILRGPILRGPILRGPILRGPVLRGPTLRGPYPLAALLCLAAAGCAPAESRNANSLADETIGIIQCDQYLASISACIRQAPAGKRDDLTAQARETFAVWKEAAANPMHRDTLPQACTVTNDLAREELAPLGCRF